MLVFIGLCVANTHPLCVCQHCLFPRSSYVIVEGKLSSSQLSETNFSWKFPYSFVTILSFHSLGMFTYSYVTILSFHSLAMFTYSYVTILSFHSLGTFTYSYVTILSFHWEFAQVTVQEIGRLRVLPVVNTYWRLEWLRGVPSWDEERWILVAWEPWGDEWWMSIEWGPFRLRGDHGLMRDGCRLLGDHGLMRERCRLRGDHGVMMGFGCAQEHRKINVYWN